MAAKGNVVFAFFCILAVAFGKPQNKPCVVHGKPIQPGATFYMGCAGLCTCGSGDSFSCVPLCAPQNYACAPGTEAKVEDMVIDTGSRECTCPNFVGCY